MEVCFGADLNEDGVAHYPRVSSKSFTFTLTLLAMCLTDLMCLT
jgi:hypothetical protein